MNYIESLRAKSKEHNSIVCMGMDPVLEKIPLKGAPHEVILKFYMDILAEMEKTGIKPAIVKPNIAFYEQYGVECLVTLKKLMKAYQEAGIPVILDAKRGDIGKTSKAYAKALFEYYEADSITIAPYMGFDSVGPFIDHCENSKGVYVLVRTSNKGAVDLQNLEVDGIPMYMKTAEKLLEWAKPGTGAVIGATYPEELKEISKYFVKSGKEIPMLIPGVGAQGGSAAEVVKMLKESGNELSIHRINSSSGINFAYIKKGTDHYAKAAVEALKELNEEIGEIFFR
ncbi:MAG: orotidine-5'-phosphate decarboxylase [Nanoarchaeota archaeon]|nr:orotidine-5'-phosphate decarboxylase [Nanoarchaeota archaeon]